MATYTSDLGSGATDTNVFDTNLLATLRRAAPQGAVLSEDSKTLSFDFPLSLGSFSFLSNSGFTGLWEGTITGIATVSEGTVITAGSGFSVNAIAVNAAIEAGEADTLNQLFWNGNDVITGSLSDDTLRGFLGRDTLLGGGGNDTLIGDDGSDRVVGGTGDDNVFGGFGNDRLFGGAGNDVIVGGAGRDVIGGGAGSDSMTGGGQADTFEFRSFGQLKGDDIDRITDFSQTDGDRIDVSLIDADGATAGNQAFRFVDQTGEVVITALPLAGDLVVTSTMTADTYEVSLYIDNEGRHLSFLAHSADGVLTADDFIL